jgi:hypothetical protein
MTPRRATIRRQARSWDLRETHLALHEIDRAAVRSSPSSAKSRVRVSRAPKEDSMTAVLAPRQSGDDRGRRSRRTPTVPRSTGGRSCPTSAAPPATARTVRLRPSAPLGAARSVVPYYDSPACHERDDPVALLQPACRRSERPCRTSAAPHFAGRTVRPPVAAPRATGGCSGRTETVTRVRLRIPVMRHNRTARRDQDGPVIVRRRKPR